MRTSSLALFLLPGLCSAQWLPQPAPSGVSVLLSVDCPSAHHGVAGGYATGFFGRAIFTTDGGTTWSPAQTPADFRSLVSVQMLDTSTGFVAGARNTSDLRTVWRAPPPSPQTPAAIARWARARRIGLDGGLDYAGMFLKTTDGGRSWSSWGTLPESTYYLLDLSFPSADTGFVTTSRTSEVGRAGILKTVNGGLTWQVLTIPDSIISLPSIRFQTSERGFAVGYRHTDSALAGVVLRTTDAGIHWEQRVFPSVDSFTGLSVLDQNTAYMTGAPPAGASVVYRTTNGGEDWAPLPFTGEFALLEGIVLAPGTTTGMVYGSTLSPQWGPFAARTTDGGLSWNPAALPALPTGSLLLGGSLITESVGWLVGGSPFGAAVILHTTNGGVTSVQSLSPVDAPDAFELLQNHPNPFNPATAIGYSLARQAAVRVEVFDPLGRRVALLVDEEQSAGLYAVRWDATGLSSGVYYYRLTAQGFTATNRMVLVK